jgi:hypothetical protein
MCGGLFSFFDFLISLIPIFLLYSGYSITWLSLLFAIMSGGVERATSAKDMPYLVIEYFRKSSLSQKIKDIQLGIRKQEAIAGTLQKIYKDETDSFGEKEVDIPAMDNRVFTERWKLIEVIVVVESSLMQTYFSYSLDHPHYSVHPLEYQSYKNHLHRFQRANNVHPLLRFCDSSRNHDIAGCLYVCNRHTADQRDLLESFPFDTIVETIESKGKQDRKRGNYKLDAGLASSQSQLRRDEWFGIAGPALLTNSHLPAVVDVRNRLYDVLPIATPAGYKKNFQVYHRPKNSELFNQNDPVKSRDGVHIHSCRFALSWKHSELAIHRDVHNDNANPNFSPVCVLSWIIKVNNKTTRLAIITYSRKSVADTMEKIERFGPALQHLTSFYQRMKADGMATITPSLFERDYQQDGWGQQMAARMKPHMNTCIHWSAMGADALLKINRKYKISQNQAMAMIYSVCASNSPDYFRVLTDQLLKDEKLAVAFFAKDALSIAIEVYETIFDFKQEASRGKHCLRGQRHQPCGNIQGSREAIAKSLQNMVTVCNSFSYFQEKNKSLRCKQDIKQLYTSTLKTFCKSETKGGVYGAGPLIANKIIQISALLGLFPFQMLTQSKIAKSTCTYRYLSSQFGLDNVDSDSPILLDALAYSTRTNQMMAEGTCCKASQEHNLLTNGVEIKAEDTIYQDMSILTLYFKKRGDISSLVIKEVTPSGKKDVDFEDLCWKSDNGTIITEWHRSIGYWMGTLERPVSRESKKLRESRRAVEKKKKKEINEWEKKVGKGQKRQRPPCRCRKKSLITLPEHLPLPWTPFNFPMMSDVIVASLDCRRPFNQWSLLGQAFGKPACQVPSKKDVIVTEHPRNRRRFAASIRESEDEYDPPAPAPCWEKSGYFEEGGRIWFPNAEIARKYAIISYLTGPKSHVLEKWCSKLINKKGNDFVPHRLKIHARRRDPQKLIVLYDSKGHSPMEPMGVCMKITSDEGAFALVDDFGRILQDTTHRFRIIDHVV